MVGKPGLTYRHNKVTGEMRPIGGGDGGDAVRREAAPAAGAAAAAAAADGGRGYRREGGGSEAARREAGAGAGATFRGKTREEWAAEAAAEAEAAKKAKKTSLELFQERERVARRGKSPTRVSTSTAAKSAAVKSAARRSAERKGRWIGLSNEREQYEERGEGGMGASLLFKDNEDDDDDGEDEEGGGDDGEGGEGDGYIGEWTSFRDEASQRWCLWNKATGETKFAFALDPSDSESATAAAEKKTKATKAKTPPAAVAAVAVAAVTGLGGGAEEGEEKEEKEEEEWQSYRDEGSNRWYQVHGVTGETRWVEDTATATVKVAVALVVEEENSEWQKYLDDGSGKLHSVGPDPEDWWSTEFYTAAIDILTSANTFTVNLEDFEGLLCQIQKVTNLLLFDRTSYGILS